MIRLSDIIADGLAKWMALRGVPRTAPQPPTSDLFSGNGYKLLHVGCGGSRKEHTTQGFSGDEWREIRLDIDPGAAPDILTSMLDMRDVPSSTADALFSSHNIEHLYPYETPIALGEFHRVLKPDGFMVLTCPDLQSICKLVVDDALDEPAYISPSGPITPLDVLYGHQAQLAAGKLFMAHRTGFTLKTLIAHVREAGFVSIAGIAHERKFELWLVASKAKLTRQELSRLAEAHWPPP